MTLHFKYQVCFVTHFKKVRKVNAYTSLPICWEITKVYLFVYILWKINHSHVESSWSQCLIFLLIYLLLGTVCAWGFYECCDEKIYTFNKYPLRLPLMLLHATWKINWWKRLEIGHCLMLNKWCLFFYFQPVQILFNYTRLLSEKNVRQ